MSITVVYSTIFNFLGLELLVVDLGHLRRFGVLPLSIAELLLSCAATSSWSSILTTIFFVVMCYTVRSIVTRLYAARKAKQAAVKHAQGAHAYNLSRALSLAREERDDLKKTNQALEKAVATANFERDSSRREVVNLRSDNANKAGFIGALQQNCQEVHALNDDLTDQLQRKDADLAQINAKLEGSQRTMVTLKEDADACEIAHQTERSSDALIMAGNENTITHLRGELRTLTADHQKTKDKLTAAKSRKVHYKDVAQVAQQSAHDAQARIAESEDQLRAAVDDKAALVSKAEKAEQATRDAKAEANEARLRAHTLQEDVQAGKEREEGLKSQLTVCEIALQRSEACAEGLKADLAGSDVQIEELRGELSSKEMAFEQLSSDNAELRDGIDTVASSSEALVEMCEAKAAEWERLYNKVLRENDTMRANIKGTRALKQTNTSLEPPSSSPSSVVESAEDSDTPSLTFSDSGAAVDDSPRQKQTDALPTPAEAHQSAVHYTFTTSTSTELVSSDTGTAFIVTSSSALSVSYEEPPHDAFAASFVPARHSTPKRSRPLRRPRLSHHGFLHKVKRCEMELPVRPAPIKTSAARPCDVPDIFSPLYRDFDAYQTRFARCLRASSESRDAQQPTVPYPVGCAVARGRILFNRSMKFAETPIVMGRR
ncbi:hypothetical protein PENSPDRAFT_758224 [Peniophora sp. CONT]|nr:hypothetical protein PENSPDRAFT_758224 [Peniophora sp. CONT]